MRSAPGTASPHLSPVLPVILALSLLVALAAPMVPPAPLADPPIHNGRAGETTVRPPRSAAEITVDGALTEPVWQEAAVLTGFSQFFPQDGVAASDSTQVLVWYSATAIHFGVRAYEPHGSVRATLAERDRIGSDDQIQFLIGTFNDGRQAVMFAVNPLGIQADGALVESGNRGGDGFGNGGNGRENADLSQDYVFKSKGRLTEWGYEVEVTIPFKSLRFQAVADQTWGINVVRRVQHSNYEDSWAPTQRGAASFLAQSGTLTGLTDLHRGLVLDVTPELTDRLDGAPGTSAWGYETGKPKFGGTVRWGITNNLTFNGTFNPDFSQVEADAGQVNFDPRRALFIPERRPFFIDGIEQFQTPNGLVYTRRIVQPEAAAKVAGKIGSTNVALMTALDGRAFSATRQDNPLFNILRVSRDLGAQSRLAMTYTDRIDGETSNRVLSVDGRAVMKRIYSGSFQIAGSRTQQGGAITSAPLFETRLARDGRAFGVRAFINGISPDFTTQTGFIARPGEVHAAVVPRYTKFFERGSRVETMTGSLNFDGTWNYRSFMRRGDIRDKKLHFNANTQLRGGWALGASLLLETFGYDPTFYAERFRIEAPDGVGGLDTLRFVGTPRLPNRDWLVSVTTPRFKYFQLSGFAVWGIDENFYEWASADILFAQFALNARPSERVRVDATYQIQKFDRRTDGSLVGMLRNPRLKMEYQVSQPFFVRVIGEYIAEEVDALRDDSRTGFPLLQRNASGTYVRTQARSSNNVRGDLLLAYTPQPGTVFYLGYGARMLEPEAFRFERVARTSDALFVKVSYLFRR
jgi:Domain of unknown function (DUF5916)